jgi:hypothetical protein
MKRLFFIAVIVFSHQPAHASWVALERAYQPTSRETVYFDPNTIHREGGRATLWQLTDITWNSTTRFLSSTTHKEFDCERSLVRVLQVIEFSRQMGKGRSTAGYIEQGGWQSVGAERINHALSKVVCKQQ